MLMLFGSIFVMLLFWFVWCYAIMCAEILPSHVTWVEAYFKCNVVANLCSFLWDGDRHRHYQGTSAATAVCTKLCSLFSTSIRQTIKIGSRGC